MMARPIQRFCGVLLALGLAMASTAGSAEDLTPVELEELEQLLARLGFFPGVVDGVIDDKSRAAIRGYQGFAALPPDGEPSEGLLAELRGVTQLMAELTPAPAAAPSSAAPSSVESSSVEPPDVESSEVEPSAVEVPAPEAPADVAAAPEPEPRSLPDSLPSEPPAAAGEPSAAVIPQAPSDTVGEATPLESEEPQAPVAPVATNLPGEPEALPVTRETASEAPSAIADAPLTAPDAEIEPLPRAGESPPVTTEPAVEAIQPAPETPLDSPTPATETVPPEAPSVAPSTPAAAVVEVAVSHPVAEPPPARRKPVLVRVPAPGSTSTASPAAETAGASESTEAIGTADMPSQAPAAEAPASEAPTGTLLEQIIAAIENPRGRASAPDPTVETHEPEAPSQPEPSPAPAQSEPSPVPPQAAGPDRFEAALAPYAPLIATDQMSKDDLAQTFNERGKALYAKGLYDQAIADYDVAIHVKPDLADAHHNRGVAYEALGNFAQAKKNFEDAKRLGYHRPGAP